MLKTKSYLFAAEDGRCLSHARLPEDSQQGDGEVFSDKADSSFNTKENHDPRCSDKDVFLMHTCQKTHSKVMVRCSVTRQIPALTPRKIMTPGVLTKPTILAKSRITMIVFICW